MEDPLRQLINDILNLSGCVVERSEDGSLDVLLTPTVAGKLGTPEETTLRISPIGSIAVPSELDRNEEEETGRTRNEHHSHIIAHTTETLDKLLSIIQGRGLLVERYVKRLYLKQGGFESAVRNHCVPLNGVGRVKSSREQTISYLVCNTQYIAFSDERKEGLVETAVNEFTGLPVGDIRSMLVWADSTPGPGPTVERKPVVQIYQAILRSSQASIASELQRFQQSLHRRLQRDFSRVREYYGTLILEIEGKIRRKGLQGKDEAVEKQRIEAVLVELRKKLIDQRERYAVKVAVQWLNAMRLFVDVVVVVYEVQRKQRTRELELIWNPLKKGFEDLACGHCGMEMGNFWMCDDFLHILCEQCSVCSQCGKNVCRDCNPQKCSRCHQSY